MSLANAGDVTYTTHTSNGTNIAIFTQVSNEDGRKSWRDPEGVVWSPYQGALENNPIHPDANEVVVDSLATEACARIGGKLPTFDQFQTLGLYFEQDKYQMNFTSQGEKDLLEIFPYYKKVYFWTSTVDPAYSRYAVAVSWFYSYHFFWMNRAEQNAVICASK